MKSRMIAAAVATAIVFLLVVLIAHPRNKAIRMEEHITSARSDISVQLKRRADLIPNLVQCVQDYDQHEYATIMAAVEARGTTSDMAVAQIQTMVQAVAEAYPELKSGENYKELMNEMATTENLLAGSRSNYSSQVRNYNQYVRSFPANKILRMTGYQVKDFEYLDYNINDLEEVRWFD